MNGQGRNTHDRPLHLHQLVHNTHTFPSHKHTSSNTEISIKPSVPQSTTICLHTYIQKACLGCCRHWLKLGTGTICMCCHDMKAISCFIPAQHHKHLQQSHHCLHNRKKCFWLTLTCVLRYWHKERAEKDEDVSLFRLFFWCTRNAQEENIKSRSTKD